MRIWKLTDDFQREDGGGGGWVGVGAGAGAGAEVGGEDAEEDELSVDDEPSKEDKKASHGRYGGVEVDGSEGFGVDVVVGDDEDGREGKGGELELELEFGKREGLERGEDEVVEGGSEAILG